MRATEGKGRRAQLDLVLAFATQPLRNPSQLWTTAQPDESRRLLEAFLPQRIEMDAALNFATVDLRWIRPEVCRKSPGVTTPAELLTTALTQAACCRILARNDGRCWWPSIRRN